MFDEKALISKLREKLNRKNIRIKDIKKEKECRRYGKILTVTYKCYFVNGNSKKVFFIKHFTDSVWKKRRSELIQITSFNKFREKLRIPLIYEVFDDLQCIIVEKVPGKKFSTILPLYMLPGIKGFKEEEIYSAIKEVAKAISFLQRISIKKDSEKVSCYDLLNKEEEKILRSFIKMQKLNSIKETLMEEKVIKTKIYGDLKLSNVLLHKGKVNIIDFFLVDGYYFEDLVKFSISLELVSKYCIWNKNLLYDLKEFFYREYRRRVPWRTNVNFLKRMELMRKCKLLCFLRKNLKTVKAPDKFLMNLNIRYLINDISKKLLS